MPAASPGRTAQRRKTAKGPAGWTGWTRKTKQGRTEQKKTGMRLPGHIRTEGMCSAGMPLWAAGSGAGALLRPAIWPGCWQGTHKPAFPDRIDQGGIGRQFFSCEALIVTGKCVAVQRVLCNELQRKACRPVTGSKPVLAASLFPMPDCHLPKGRQGLQNGWIGNCGWKMSLSCLCLPKTLLP